MRSFKTLKKGIAIRKKETAAMLKAAGEPPASTTTTTTADAAAAAPAVRTTPVEKEIVGDDKANAAADGSDDALEAKDVNGVEAVEVKVTVEEGGKARRTSTELQAILDDNAKQYPVWAWSLLAPMTLFTVVYAIVKKQIKDSEGCVEAGYWLWYLGCVGIVVQLRAWHSSRGRSCSGRIASSTERDSTEREASSVPCQLSRLPGT